ncbi:hypothetical protein BDV26DRAFT_259709 [Aspergillus bertholletiae]|uniref:Uncharacterized protein n=1 Tax=Aspergillus bertholletiae TaxID=1226010 RepID=A0A5N7BC90_9EURO|nr:hypothetical protein BDV26DRAFT_259709 [Aspergillus bertholletiae]
MITIFSVCGSESSRIERGRFVVSPRRSTKKQIRNSKLKGKKTAPRKGKQLSTACVSKKRPQQNRLTAR